MKKYIIILVLLFSIFPFFTYSQCKEFTEADVIPLLGGDYILSGRYNSLRLSEGEEILIFKTLSKGISYRFVVCGAEDLPNNVEFEILDWDDKQIYTNKTDKYAKAWDYASTSSQRIKIIIRIPKDSDTKTTKVGCVALVTGIKN